MLMPIDKNPLQKRKRNLQANVTDTIILNKNFGKANLSGVYPRDTRIPQYIQINEYDILYNKLRDKRHTI